LKFQNKKAGRPVFANRPALQIPFRDLLLFLLRGLLSLFGHRAFSPSNLLLSVSRRNARAPQRSLNFFYTVSFARSQEETTARGRQGTTGV
jgi:hypothetical protein